MPAIKPAIRAYLQMTLFIRSENLAEVLEGIYEPLRQRFLARVSGAVSQNLLLREADMQILHGFDTLENASAYLESDLCAQALQQLSEHQDQNPVMALYSVHD